jgi:multidrug efflux pump subunit AcrB
MIMAMFVFSTHLHHSPVQFRNLKETIIIMFTIPLSLSGAMLGLALTGTILVYSFLRVYQLVGIRSVMLYPLIIPMS